jgi:aspartate/methionine/tyrosine aminotransferase
MNPLAEELNQTIANANPHLMEMLSDVGKKLFFPKGILSQSAEAKEKAHKINATIGIAKENGHTMHFKSVMDAICEMRPSESITYAPSFGIPALRKLWQTSQLEKNPTLQDKRISLPVVTSGITHGVSTVSDVWVDPGDVIVLPDMMWGNYNMIFSVKKGATIVQYPIFNEAGGYNLDALEATVKAQAQKHAKVIVLLNFPHNPTGYSISKTEGARIAKILQQTAAGGTNVIAVTDDSYFGLFYEEETLKESMFALLCDLHPRLLAIKLDGATKENFVWGLRVGFITYGCSTNGDAAPMYDALERKTAGCIRGTISNASHLGQSIILKSMQSQEYPGEKKEKSATLKARAERVKQVLTDPKYHAAWDVYPFNSGYFMCIRLKTVDAETLRKHILDKYGVGLIATGGQNLRVAFSCVDEPQIPELFDTVLQGVKELEGTA